ncbi:MAG: hypothetical protein PHV39_08375, partial [Methanomicrobium sp.]|nr:hypothetical protein [Methanomicrobium sp.]
HAYFDISIKFVQIKEAISVQSDMSYAEYQKNLRDSINQLEDMRSDAEYLLIVAGNIDTSELPPESSDSINLIEDLLNSLISNIDSTLSVLYSYR